MNLVQKIAAYELTITSQRPLETILLQSSQSVDILEIKDKVAKENRVKDDTHPQNVLLTTLQIDSADVKKITLKIRTAEGQQGSLNAFLIEKVTNNQNPICATLDIPLKPLNLHERVSPLSVQEMEDLPMSRVVINGRFSQQDAL